jgi:hypothetical protein
VRQEGALDGRLSVGEGDTPHLMPPVRTQAEYEIQEQRNKVRLTLDGQVRAASGSAILT